MPSSGRFQSRLFSEINRQRLRWGDRLGRGWRYSRMSLIWATQILLYPIYAGFQTVRLLGRQLAQAPRKLQEAGNILRRAVGLETPPPTPALTSSTPIQHTLQAIEALGVALPSGAAIAALPGSTALVASDPASLTTVTIQGIASDREQQHLVLVSSRNQLLDVLTEAQQEILRQRIIVELAEYWRDRHQARAKAQPALPLPPPRPTSRMLPPVRWFYQLMQWEQRSDIALATNLFQESALTLYFDPDREMERVEGQATIPDWDRLIASAVHPPTTMTPYPAEMALRSQLAALEKGTSLTWVGEEAASTDLSVFGPPTTDLQPTLVSTSVALESYGLSELQGQPSGLSPSTTLEPYVETKAQLVEYVKHPLEQVLEWLDRGMAWLENRMMALRDWWNQQRS